MDIKDIRERKKNIEFAIKTMLQSFEKDTGIEVKSIALSWKVTDRGTEVSNVELVVEMNWIT